MLRDATTEKEAKHAKAFFDWVKNDWNNEEDNIHLWDFRRFQTKGGLYFRSEYANSFEDSHPNESFSQKVAPLLCEKVVEVIATLEQ